MTNAAWLADDVLLTGEGPAIAPRWTPDRGLPATDLRSFLRERAAGQPREARTRLVASLASLMGDERASSSLPDGLHLVRETLRERLPRAVVDAAAPRLLHVERLDRLGERAFIVHGWAASALAGTSLTAVAPEGARAELGAAMYRYARRDVEDFLGGRRGAAPFGFVAYFELDAPSRRSDGWIFELRDDEGGVETAPLRVETSSDAVRDSLLHTIALAPSDDEELLDEHLRPALTRLQERRDRRVGVREIDVLGEVPEDPMLSIVVPLYGRIDFLEHQLASFADDPELRDCELIYVLDSPEHAEELAALARQLFALYRLPFRVVHLTANGGFSVANNRGAEIARAPRLLLLNSDVIPREPGWAGRLVAFHDATPGAGAVAPKLLYEDDAIQHAGVYFRREPGGAVWFNEHFHKGMHRTLPAANVTARVPALSAACLLLDRALYERLGGLSVDYVQGDYEDTDLCLRIGEEGLDCWYVPEVELYHLEGQSYPSATRQLSSAYNRWLHTRRWDVQIKAAMANQTERVGRNGVA